MTAIHPPEPEHQKYAAELVSRLGCEAVSFHGIKANFDYWFTESKDGCVAYVDTGSAWVALGSPIASPNEIEPVARAFIEAAAHKKRHARFFAVEANSPLVSSTMGGKDGELKQLIIGQQPEWNPAEWKTFLRTKRSLREQLRRARAKGVAVCEVELTEQTADNREGTDLAELARRWQQTKPMPPMKFAVSLTLFAQPSSRRLFWARQQNTHNASNNNNDDEYRLIAALIASPIGADGDWFIEDLLRDPNAPNGTMELLFDTAMTSFANEGSRRVTMGLAPLAGVPSAILRTIRVATPWLYDWDGLRNFKAKLGPSSWQPVYLVFPRSDGPIRSMLDSLRCFAGGSLVGFGIHFILHRYRAILWLMAMLLIPWTAALTSSQASLFFPSEEIQTGWFIFDVFIFAGLVQLATRWTRPLCQLLAIGATADAIMGITQLIGWNAVKTSGFGWPFVAIAITAPLGAAIYLTLLSIRHPKSDD